MDLHGYMIKGQTNRQEPELAELGSGPFCLHLQGSLGHIQTHLIKMLKSAPNLNGCSSQRIWQSRDSWISNLLPKVLVCFHPSITIISLFLSVVFFCLLKSFKLYI